MHVLFREELCDDEPARDEAVHAVVRVSGLHDWDIGRLRRFGILTGWVRPDRVESIKAVPGVQSVSENTTRQY